MSRWTIDNREPVRTVPDLDSGARDPERRATERDKESRPCTAREDIALGRREPANRDFKLWGPYWPLPTAWEPCA